MEKQKRLIKQLVKILDTEKGEEERIADFERRIIEDAEKLLG